MKAFIAILCGITAFALFSLTQIEAKDEKVQTDTEQVSVKLDNMKTESFSGKSQDQKRNQAEIWE